MECGGGDGAGYCDGSCQCVKCAVVVCRYACWDMEVLQHMMQYVQVVAIDAYSVKDTLKVGLHQWCRILPCQLRHKCRRGYLCNCENDASCVMILIHFHHRGWVFGGLQLRRSGGLS